MDGRPKSAKTNDGISIQKKSTTAFLNWKWKCMMAQSIDLFLNLKVFGLELIEPRIRAESHKAPW